MRRLSANQSFQQFLNITGGEDSYFADRAWLYGLILSLLLGLVIIGGIKSIAKVTEKLVPLMALVYIVCALIIIIINYNFIGQAFVLIYNGAFTSR